VIGEEERGILEIGLATEQLAHVLLLEVVLQRGYPAARLLGQDARDEHVVHPEVLGLLGSLVQPAHHVRCVDNGHAGTVFRVVAMWVLLVGHPPFGLEEKGIFSNLATYKRV